MNEKRVYKTPTPYQYLFMKQVTIVLIMLSACAISAHALPLFNMFSNAKKADADMRGRNLVQSDGGNNAYVSEADVFSFDVDHRKAAASVVASVGDISNAKVDMTMGLISGPQDIYMGTFEDEYSYYKNARFLKEQAT